MISLTARIPLFGTVLIAAATAACNPVEEVGCPLANCAFEGDQGVHITVENALDRFSGDLPATVTACAGSRCVEVVMRLSGNTIACISNDIRATCEVGDDGTLKLDFAVTLPDDPMAIRLAVVGTSGATLFEDTKTLPVTEDNPAGLDCPQTCREVDVVFSPPPAEPQQPGP
jgi:hypothetical protein